MNNYRRISLLSASHKTFSAGMGLYANEIIEEYQHGFRRNRSTINYILNIRKLLENEMG